MQAKRTSHQCVEQCSLNWLYRNPKSSFIFFFRPSIKTVLHTIQVIFWWTFDCFVCFFFTSLCERFFSVGWSLPFWFFFLLLVKWWCWNECGEHYRLKSDIIYTFCGIQHKYRHSWEFDDCAILKWKIPKLFYCT